MEKAARKQLIADRAQALRAVEKAYSIGGNYATVCAVAEVKKGQPFLAWLFSETRGVSRCDIARRRAFHNAEEISWAGSTLRDGREFSHARADHATAAQTADRQSAPSLLNALVDKTAFVAQTDGATCDGDAAGANFDAGSVPSTLEAQENRMATL